MWNDIVIGTGKNGCCAVRVFDIGGEHSISENATSYWVTDAWLEARVVIFKNTEEGQYLATKVKDKIHIDELQPWLSDLVLKHASHAQLKRMVDNAIKRAYREGSERRARAIREALGLSH